MPAPTQQHIELLGPAALPFERRGFDRPMLDGEDIHFVDHLYDATEDGKPENVVEVNPETIELDPEAGRYLWVITVTGMHLILEETPNVASARKKVCHSNITGGQAALQGGELWFGTDEKVYINYRSGRYGAMTEDHMQTVVDYFIFVGYEQVIVIG
jgi:outer membrane protein assembly factor BamB